MEKPIVLVIMDGVGTGDGASGDAVKGARTVVEAVAYDDGN